MTTVAVHRADPDEGGKFTIAADRDAFTNNMRAEQTCKLLRLSSGAVLTGAGDVPDLFRLFRWFQAGNKVADADNANAPRMPNDRGVVVHVDTDGAITLFAEGGHYPEDDFCRGFGSGGLAARVAMRMGAGARRAVEVASEFDPWTSSQVDVVHLIDGEFRGSCLPGPEPKSKAVEGFSHLMDGEVRVVPKTSIYDARIATVARLVIAANPFQADLARRSPAHNLDLVLEKVMEATGFEDSEAVAKVVKEVLREPAVAAG